MWDVSEVTSNGCDFELGNVPRSIVEVGKLASSISLTGEEAGKTSKGSSRVGVFDVACDCTTSSINDGSGNCNNCSFAVRGDHLRF